ncbi:MAG: alpha/beta fold hydrolase [Acidimicrobiales bacterium]
MSSPFVSLRSRAAIFVIAALLGSLGVLAALVGVGSSSRGRSPADAMVDVGGYKLNLSCSGEGSPTVLLESGNGPTSAGWAWVQPQIAKTSRVCSYDRAGTGRSDESPNLRDAQNIALELHQLLDAAEIDRPLVLVGHSYGGLYARQYAAMYPAEVAGMVLVDSAHPDQWTRHPAAAEQYAAMAASMREPITVSPPNPPENPDLPSSASKRMAVEGNTLKHLNTARAEFLATGDTNDQVRRSSVSVGGIPLVVLSATEHDFPPELQVQMESSHLQMQKELSTLSSRALLRLEEGADHNGLLANEEMARATAGSIEDVLRAVRPGGTLPVA